MQSKIARDARLALIAEAKRLTPEQRLDAFLAHCQLVMELRTSGQQVKSSRVKASA
jgi:hypothetical protein